LGFAYGRELIPGANLEIGVPRGTNRNAPAGAEAQFPTGILYHNGNAGQVEELGAKERKVKGPTLAKNRTARVGHPEAS